MNFVWKSEIEKFILHHPRRCSTTIRMSRFRLVLWKWNNITAISAMGKTERATRGNMGKPIGLIEADLRKLLLLAWWQNLSYMQKALLHVRRGWNRIFWSTSQISWRWNWRSRVVGEYFWLVHWTRWLETELETTINVQVKRLWAGLHQFYLSLLFMHSMFSKKSEWDSKN